MNRIESVPTTWDALDVAFFRCVEAVFDCRFCEAASALLCSYDPEPTPVS